MKRTPGHDTPPHNTIQHNNPQRTAKMQTATATLKSVSPLIQSRFHDTEKLEKESHGDYEKRTWREKAHFNENGFVCVPPFALKNAIGEAAKFISMQIKGKGKATYTKHFDAGVLVQDPMVLGVKKENLSCTTIHCNADGIHGSGKRVMKMFPTVPVWTGVAVFYVLDDTITHDVFEHHLKEAGNFIGIGSFRPRNRGINGRFIVDNIVWNKRL